jgi:phage regulator Rha-like protein
MKLQLIQNRIYEVRGEKVMLDFDLAKLYEVETRIFNQAVKRNKESFPKDFMFKLTAKEWTDILDSQILVVENSGKKNSSQFVMSSLKHRSNKYLPHAFTEHGVTMLASVLKSSKARKMNIAIVRAFIALKKLVHTKLSAISLVKELRDRIDEHDVQLKSIYDALENMLDEKEEEKLQKLKWEKRERIGFKK